MASVGRAAPSGGAASPPRDPYRYDTACEHTAYTEEVAADEQCRAWVGEQQLLGEAVLANSVRTYTLEGHVEEAELRVEAGPQGAVEAWIRAIALPPTGAAAVTAGRVLVQLTRYDSERGERVAVASSTPGADPARPETWTQLPWDLPIRGDLFLDAAAARAAPYVIRYPGQPRRVTVLSYPFGYQIYPDLMSEDLPVPAPVSLRRWRDVELFGDAASLWAVQAGRVTAFRWRPLRDAPPTSVVEVPDRLRMFWTGEFELQGPGMCGSCPARGVWVLDLLPNGELTKTLSDHLVIDGIDDSVARLSADGKSAQITATSTEGTPIRMAWAWDGSNWTPSK